MPPALIVGCRANWKPLGFAIVDDLGGRVDRLKVADQRPTAECDNSLGRAFDAKGITRPTTVLRPSLKPTFKSNSRSALPCDGD